MKKTIVAAIVAFAMADVFAQASPDANNLLKNPEFKTNAAGKLLNWSSYPSFQVKDGTLTLDVKKSQPWHKNVLWAGISQHVNMAASGEFKLSFDFMATKNVDTLLIRIVSMDRATKKYAKVAEKSISAKNYADAMKKVEYSFTLPESNASFGVHVDCIAKASAADAGPQFQIKNIQLSPVK